MSRLYRSKEILNDSQAAKTLEFAVEWTRRTACGKLILSKDEVLGWLDLCNNLAKAVDANMEAFEDMAEKRDEAESKLRSEKSAKPLTTVLQDAIQNEAEELA